MYKFRNVITYEPNRTRPFLECPCAIVSNRASYLDSVHSFRSAGQLNWLVFSCISSVPVGSFSLSIKYATTACIHALPKSLFCSERVHSALYIIIFEGGKRFQMNRKGKFALSK
jgi:hypothetical protein